MIRRIVSSAGLVLLAVVFAHALPDIAHYLKIRET
jgi:hypothetical protein